MKLLLFSIFKYRLHKQTRENKKYYNYYKGEYTYGQAILRGYTSIPRENEQLIWFVELKD